MNLLRIRLIGLYLRSFSTNSYGYSLSNDHKSFLEQPISRDDPQSSTGCSLFSFLSSPANLQ